MMMMKETQKECEENTARFGLRLYSFLPIDSHPVLVLIESTREKILSTSGSLSKHSLSLSLCLHICSLNVLRNNNKRQGKEELTIRTLFSL